MLDFQLSTIVFTILNLLILYAFLRKFLFGRVNAVMEEREKLIQEQIKEIPRERTRQIVQERLIEIEKGNRDFRF